ncbi:MAG: alpha/beta hydrolase [Pseudomonadota bacterium]
MSNRQSLVVWVALGLVALLSGCESSDLERKGPIVGVTLRADASPINWTLEPATSGRTEKILLVSQGSGCAPARSSVNVEMISALAVDFATLTIEKYGVKPSDAPSDPSNDCSTAYFENHTVSQRVMDAKMVLADLDRRGQLPYDLALFGGSEGGAVVSILAHEVPEARAVVVLSTGTGLTMSEFFPMVVPPPVAAQMEVVFEAARANPESTEIAGGNSYKWWADVLDRRLSDDLLKSTVPILIVHGEKDRSAPVLSARAARDAFSEAGESERLTYWEFEGFDHQMVDGDGVSHMGDVLADVVSWLNDGTDETPAN